MKKPERPPAPPHVEKKLWHHAPLFGTKQGAACSQNPYLTFRCGSEFFYTLRQKLLNTQRGFSGSNLQSIFRTSRTPLVKAQQQGFGGALFAHVGLVQLLSRAMIGTSLRCRPSTPTKARGEFSKLRDLRLKELMDKRGLQVTVQI